MWRRTLSRERFSKYPCKYERPKQDQGYSIYTPANPPNHAFLGLVLTDRIPRYLALTVVGQGQIQIEAGRCGVAIGMSSVGIHQKPGERRGGAKSVHAKFTFTISNEYEL